MRTNYVKKLSVRDKWVHYLLVAVLFFITLFIMVENISHYWSYWYFNSGDFGVAFDFIDLIPIVFFSACGYVYSLILVVALVIYTLIFDINQAYMLSIYLPLIGLVYFATKYRLLNKAIPSLITAILTSALIGNLWYLILCIPHPVGFSYINPIGQLCMLVATLPESLIAYLLLFCFYRFAPDRIKRLFFGGNFYLNDTDAEEITYKRSVLGQNVTIGLLLDLVIIMAASLTLTYVMLEQYSVYPGMDQYIEENSGNSNVKDLHFFQTIKNYYKKLDEYGDSKMGLVAALGLEEKGRPGEGHQIELPMGPSQDGEASGSQDYDALTEATSNYRPFTYSAEVMTYSFFAELSLVLFTIAASVIILSNSVVQIIVINPLRGLSEYIRGYVKTEEAERSKYIQSFSDYEPPVHDEIWELYDSIRIMIKNVEEYVDALHNQQTLEN
ncbi:MAG: hypothetical protein J6N76_09485, partial [Lachnospiraceae bacterium]|nr:hypothetical protein [Lachnospiraceae bacterium]